MALCLVHGANQYPDGRINEETKARCNRAVELYRQKEIKKVFITCCSERGGRSLAEEMKNYFIARDIRRQNIIADPRGQNTAGEIDVFLSLVRGEVRLADISSWYHIPRIFIIYLLRRKVIRHYASFGPVRLHDVFREFPAILNTLLRPRKASKVLRAP